MQISGNLSKQPFSKGSGRITLKTAYKIIFIPENPQILGCRFLDALVLIRGFLLYLTLIGLGFFEMFRFGGGGPPLYSLFVNLSQRNFVQGLTIKALAQIWKKIT